MQIEILCIAALAGAALGLRLKSVFIFPAVAVTTVVVASVEFASAMGMRSSLLWIVLSVAALQTGYLAGVLCRALRNSRFLHAPRITVFLFVLFASTSAAFWLSAPGFPRSFFLLGRTSLSAPAPLWLLQWMGLLKRPRKVTAPLTNAI
jgi:hypothetical protein